MANKVQILAKIARDVQMLGLTVNSQSASAIVVENGSNDLTITYADASIAAPMGGIDSTVSPYLGMGVVQPGKIQITGSIVTKGSANTFADLMDTIIAGKVLCLCHGFGNNILLTKPDVVGANSYNDEIAGDVMLKNVGM